MSKTKEPFSDAQTAFLEGYAGPAVVLDETGVPTLANGRGGNLLKLVERGLAEDVAALIARARDENSVTNGMVALDGSKGDVVLDVTVIPQPECASFLLLGRDTSMERNLRSALVESRQRYKDLVEVSSDFSWEIGADKQFSFVSPVGALGHEAEELIGRIPDELVINPEEYDPLPFYSTHPRNNVEIWMMCKDGSHACVMASTLPLYDEEANWCGARGVCRDVTEERERETALMRSRHREQILGYIVNTIRDELDPNNMLDVAATTVARALGSVGGLIFRTSIEAFLVSAVFGEKQNMDEICAGLLPRLENEGNVIEAEAGEWQILIAATRYHQPINGAICLWKRGIEGGWEDDDVILIGDVANQVGIIVEQVANHERILKLSRTDGLTGLLNRRAFIEEEIPRRIQRAQKSDDKLCALLYIDMDNFKQVNDVHGHQKGDEVIIFLRDMMIKNTRPGDAIARLGGDEFGIWLDEITEKATITRAEGLIEAALEMRQFSGHDDCPLGISIGIGLYDPHADETLDDLISRADQTMYDVKRSGKGGFKLSGVPVQKNA